MISGFAAGRNALCGPDYNPLCSNTIMNNILLWKSRNIQLKEFIYNTSLLQICSIMNISKYMANQMKCEFTAALALNASEMLSQNL